MNNKQLKTFVTVANCLSFAEAAKQLHVSQPALSQTIKALELSVGGTLFHRTTRTIALSAEAEALLPKATELLRHWDNVEEEIRQRFALKIGRIAVAAMPSYASSVLPAILKSYTEAHPEIHIEVHDVLTDTVIEYVREQRFELGICFKTAQLDQDLNFHPLYLDRFKLVVPKHSPLATKTEVRWADIAAEDFIALQAPSSVRSLIDTRLADYGTRLETTYDTNQLTTVGKMVAVGLGVSIVPQLCEEQMQQQGCACIDLVEPVIETWVGVVSKPRSMLSVPGSKLLDSIKQHYAPQS